MTLSILNSFEKETGLFQKLRVVAIGDIAFDRTFLCRKGDKDHAVHESDEETFDVEPNGADLGTVGSSANTCWLANTLGAYSTLITVIGDDSEGNAVTKWLSDHSIASRVLEIPRLQTITRFRSFVYHEQSQTYISKFRMYK